MIMDVRPTINLSRASCTSCSLREKMRNATARDKSLTSHCQVRMLPRLATESWGLSKQLALWPLFVFGLLKGPYLSHLGGKPVGYQLLLLLGKQSCRYKPTSVSYCCGRLIMNPWALALLCVGRKGEGGGNAFIGCMLESSGKGSAYRLSLLQSLPGWMHSLFHI